MSEMADRIREIAGLLPGAAESQEEGAIVFRVEGAEFARWSGDAGTLQVHGADAVVLTSPVDWVLVEDGIARGWELVAPPGLLEAGGR